MSVNLGAKNETLTSPDAFHTRDAFLYSYNAESVVLMRQNRPWEKNPKHFKHVRISALAAMKMLKHALTGVEKGRKAGTAPQEIMGLMIGKAEGDTIIVLDSCPLPVEGSETRVVADDAQVHMTELLDSLELRRKDGFIGWYHSHPFELESYSHCHLSATDVQTQTIWQNSSPTWIALVVDPLRSVFRQEPEFGVYRVYPPNHNPPANECPDGQFNADITSRTMRWGLTFHRYYSLQISFFISELGAHLLDTMSRNNLWVRVLSSAAFAQSDARARVSERVKKLAERLSSSESHVLAQTSGLGQGLPSSVRRKPADLDDSLSTSASEIAVEHCKAHISSRVKDALFTLIMRQEKRRANVVAPH